MDASADQYCFKVTWLPFLLRPEMPLEGKEKAPNTPDNPRVGARLKQAGESVGVDFTGKCDRYPNTVRSHILTDMALETGKQDELATHLLYSYFTAGDDVSNVDNLVRWGTEIAGLDEERIRAAMADEALFSTMKEQVVRDQREQGVTGVPFFIMNGQRMFSGAQDPAQFQQAFRIAVGR